MARRRKKGEERAIAARRIHTLLDLAQHRTIQGDPNLADRYAGLAWRIKTRYQIRLNPDTRASVCRKCGAYRASHASRVRIRNGRIVTTCTCGHIHRRPLHATK